MEGEKGSGRGIEEGEEGGERGEKGGGKRKGGMLITLVMALLKKWGEEKV